VEHAAAWSLPVAVGTQTNSQADDVCRRLARSYPEIRVHRFASKASTERDLGPSVRWVRETNRLPSGRCVVVGTVAKWGLTSAITPFHCLMIDEAWQMSWSDFMLCGAVSERFVLIGDPGQIPPVVPVPVHRWETSPRAPHQPAPELILDDTGLVRRSLALPACWRLPFDSVDLVRPFYDFPFGAWARAGERYVGVPSPRHRDHPSDRALDLLSDGSVAALVLPTPPEGAPLELDLEVARAAAGVAARLIERRAVALDDDNGRAAPLRADDIGLVATHRVVNHAIQQALPSELRGQAVVDTPERWQGLERKVMILVHPLSGVTSPSAFDLETGRLCVMTSRHRSGMIVVSRDHVRQTLETHIPFAEQAVGRPDVAGRGHEANLRFWERVERGGRVVRAA
ncbi:MAG: hypothetical protein ACREX3_04475, partial [Gammaproteobacteria bacterium]